MCECVCVYAASNGMIKKRHLADLSCTTTGNKYLNREFRMQRIQHTVFDQFCVHLRRIRNIEHTTDFICSIHTEKDLLNSYRDRPATKQEKKYTKSTKKLPNVQKKKDQYLFYCCSLYLRCIWLYAKQLKFYAIKFLFVCLVH